MKLFCVWLFFGLGLLAEEIKVSIAPYLDDKRGAITYTFDDGLRDQFTEALPVIEALGFKGTFFIIPFLTPNSVQEAQAKKAGSWGGISWVELKEIATKGHEIGNHSLEHKNLVSLDKKAIHHQIDKAQELIKEKLGITPHTFCCPYNSTNAEVSEIIDSKLPFRRKHLCGFGNKISTNAMNDRVNKAMKTNFWDVVMIHGISVGYDKFEDPQRLFDHWAYVKSIEADIWVDTFAAIGSYKALAKSAKVHFERKENSLICHLKADKAILPHTELTLVIQGLKASSIEASQGINKLPIKSKGEKIHINIHPNNQPINIIWK